MLCELCKKRPATFHFTKIMDGEKQEMNLCQECAQSSQAEWPFSMEPSFSIHKFLANLMEFEPVSKPAVGRTGGYTCEQCGLNYSQFSQSGKLGCSSCYDTFYSQLLSLFRRIQGSNKHAGKAPLRTGKATLIKREISQLKEKLKMLVAREEFEQAAQVRDQIKSLEQKMQE